MEAQRHPVPSAGRRARLCHFGHHPYLSGHLMIVSPEHKPNLAGWRGIAFGFDKLNPGLNYSILKQYKSPGKIEYLPGTFMVYLPSSIPTLDRLQLDSLGLIASHLKFPKGFPGALGGDPCAIKADKAGVPYQGLIAPLFEFSISHMNSACVVPIGGNGWHERDVIIERSLMFLVLCPGVV
jgi:hypothetical protein